MWTASVGTVDGLQKAWSEYQSTLVRPRSLIKSSMAKRCSCLWFPRMRITSQLRPLTLIHRHATQSSLGTWRKASRVSLSNSWHSTLSSEKSTTVMPHSVCSWWYLRASVSFCVSTPGSAPGSSQCGRVGDLYSSYFFTVCDRVMRRRRVVSMEERSGESSSSGAAAVAVVWVAERPRRRWSSS